MSTHTVAIYPVISALYKALEFGKALSPWASVNDFQKAFLEKYNRDPAELLNFSPEELQAVASIDVSEVNNFLKEKGFDIQLQPEEDPHAFFTASVMSVLVQWANAGRKVELNCKDGNLYPGVMFSDNDCISFRKVESYDHPIAAIQCKDKKDTVFMTVADEELEGFALLDKVMKLTSNDSLDGYKGLKFPMVELNQEEDISLFKGMSFRGLSPVDGSEWDFRISQAKQQTKFKMNYEGAKAESAAAFAIRRVAMVSKPPPMMVIDQPFYVWMVRDSLSQPYFAAYVDYSNFKDPGEL